MYSAIVEFFSKGGAFMYPIALVFVLGVAIASERYLYLTLSRARNRRLWQQLVPLLQQGNIRQAAELCHRSRAAIAAIANYGLARLAAARRRDDVDKAMDESLMEVKPRLVKRTHYLTTLANIATLLGLLGTIIGLIDAFTAVAAAHPADRSDLLSASISVAMNTTAFGLIVAVPLLVLHAVIQSKTTELVDSLHMASVKFLSTVAERRGKDPEMASQG